MTSPTRRTLLVASIGGLAGRARAAAGITNRSETVRLGTSDLDVTRYAAPIEASRPTVLILHGSKGLDAHRSAYERYAQALAAAGLDALLFTYYRPDDLAIIGGAGDASGREAQYRRASDRWIALVRGVGTWAKGQARSSGAVGLLGFSLGGMVAVSAASEPLFGVLTVFYAGLPTFTDRPIVALPPLMDLHGAADRAVPLREGSALVATAKRLGGPAELVVFPGEGHGFDLDPSNRDAARAQRCAVAFTSHWIGRA